MNRLLQILLLLVAVLVTSHCGSNPAFENRPYVCKAVADDEDKTSHGGHFFKHPNPNTAKIQAVRMCREKHRICFIDYCNRDFQNQPEYELRK